MEGSGNNGRWPSNPYHMHLPHTPQVPRMYTTQATLPVLHNRAAGSTTENQALQKFISNVRDDDALCNLIKERKTRWIEEEDEYANFLVQEFERGMAKEVAENTTLRAYLSRKLICTPMRISKKFHGKKVGTIQYKNKVVASKISIVSAQTHLMLEQKCLAALVAQLNRAKKARKLNDKSKSSIAFEGSREIIRPAQQVQTQVSLPTLSVQAVQHMDKQTATEIRQQNGYRPPSIKEHGQVIGPYQAFNNTGFCSSLHRSSNGNLLMNPHHFMNRSQVTTQVNPSYAPNRQVDLTTPQDQSAVHLQQHTTSNAKEISTAAPTAPVHVAQRAPVHSIKNNTTCSDGSMVDLVAGFDKHAATLKTKPDITTILESRPSSTTWPNNSHFFSGGGVEDSPYITSQSFDDMHKCLGGIDMPSDPPHFDLNAAENTIESKALTNTCQPNISAESPYVTSKSFDDMHRCLGVGLPSSTAMSHIDLGDSSSKSGKSQDNDSTESSSAYAESSSGVDIDKDNREVLDPRSNKLLSAFSPFDGSRVEQETNPCNFDAMMRRVSAPPLQVHQVIQATPAANYPESKTSYGTNTRLNPAQTFNMSLPSNYGLAMFFNNRNAPLQVHPVSTSTSEQSSDRGNSSPDGADVQSD